MESIRVTLPDGSEKSVPQGSRPLDVAESISPRLAKAALVAELDGKLVDLTQPFTADTKLRILTDRDPEALEVYRHSSAHLLAIAVQELYPETKLGIGPPIENGFYYDFLRETPFTPDDLETIEQRMAEIVQPCSTASKRCSSRWKRLFRKRARVRCVRWPVASVFLATTSRRSAGCCRVVRRRGS
jgi:threonyl-tRNA synthetase